MSRLATLLLLSLLCASAQAQPWREGGWLSAKNEHATQGQGLPSGLSLDQAVAQVKRESGGRILSAETVQKNGRTVHRIKVLTPQQKVIIREVEAGGR